MAKKQRDHVQEDFISPFWDRGRQRSNPAEIATEQIELMVQRIVGELCINRFNWRNLPDSVNTRYMEVSLYNYACVVIFKDTMTDKLLAVRANPVGGYDMNQEPLAFRLTPSANGTLPQHLHNLTLSARHVVPVWANAFRIPDRDVVEFYSARIAQTERTIDVNLKAARHTKILAYNENSRLSIENINRALDNGDAAVPVNITLTALAEAISVLDMGIHPEQIERLSIVRDRFWNNLMGLLGINNSNQDKKERLVASESEGNDDQVGNFRRINLNWRQKAADRINKKWPELLLDGPVSVDYYTDIDSDRPLFPDESGGIEDADIHAGTVPSS